MTKKRHQNIPVSYLILFKDNKILLLRRFNTGYEDGKYSMVAGGMLTLAKLLPNVSSEKLRKKQEYYLNLKT